MRLFKRKRIIVDSRSQGALILRVVVYWTFSILAVGMLMVLWDIGRGTIGPLFTPNSLVVLRERFGSLFVASLLVLPVLVADAWIQSNRFAGPIHRLRTCLRDLSAGRPVGRVEFRKGDYWPGLADDLNAAVDFVNGLKAETRKTATVGCCESEREPEPAGIG